jgi:methanogenic corrinoid protein MtbC1
LSARSELTELLINFDERAIDVVKKRLDAKEDPNAIIGDMIKAMEVVGKKYEKQEYFLAEVVVAADIFKSAMALIRPKLMGSQAYKIGKVAIGTAKGDVHSMGKDIVAAFLESVGFDVLDLGADVPPQKFVEAASSIDIVAISGLMTTSAKTMAETMKAMEVAGVRDKVKVIIGGPQVDEQWSELILPDFHTQECGVGVSKMKEWAEEKRRRG